jgi:hydroxymethylglutaryl-CoA reductase
MTVMAEKKLHEMSREERLDFIRRSTQITEDIQVMLRPLPFEDANRMIENAIGIMSIPLGIATNFVINGREYVIPMAIEEPSVIAAVSKAAKIAKLKGGFIAKANDSVMIGQVQVVGLDNVKHAMTKILRNTMQSTCRRDSCEIKAQTIWAICYW